MELKLFMRRIMIVIILLGLAVPLIQIYKIHKSKSSLNVPIGGYVVNMIVGAFWLLYGLLHKDWLIIFSAVLNLCVNITIISMARYYGTRTTDCCLQVDLDKDD